MNELRPNELRLQVLAELIQQWSEIVAHMKRGYTLTFDDYLNDLDLRRLLDERVRDLKTEGGAELREPLAVALSAADELFMQATEPSGDNVWGEENAKAEGWSPEVEWFYYRQLREKSPPQ